MYSYKTSIASWCHIYSHKMCLGALGNSSFHPLPHNLRGTKVLTVRVIEGRTPKFYRACPVALHLLYLYIVSSCTLCSILVSLKSGRLCDTHFIVGQGKRKRNILVGIYRQTSYHLSWENFAWAANSSCQNFATFVEEHLPPAICVLRQPVGYDSRLFPRYCLRIVRRPVLPWPPLS